MLAPVLSPPGKLERFHSAAHLYEENLDVVVECYAPTAASPCVRTLMGIWLNRFAIVLWPMHASGLDYCVVLIDGGNGPAAVGISVGGTQWALLV